ncbi:hypothetical protein V6Z12_D01G060300 [Gossypium hirsutum]
MYFDSFFLYLFFLFYSIRLYKASSNVVKGGRYSGYIKPFSLFVKGGPVFFLKKSIKRKKNDEQKKVILHFFFSLLL